MNEKNFDAKPCCVSESLLIRNSPSLSLLRLLFCDKHETRSCIPGYGHIRYRRHFDNCTFRKSLVQRQRYGDVFSVVLRVACLDSSLYTGDFCGCAGLGVVSDRVRIGYRVYLPRDLLYLEVDRLKAKTSERCHPTATSGFLIQ